jgi:hypothetical protein
MKQKPFPRMYSDAWLKELKAAIKHPGFSYKPSNFIPRWDLLKPKEQDNLRIARALLGCTDEKEIPRPIRN